MDHKTLDEMRELLESMERELVEAVESDSDATATVQLDTSIGRLSRVDAIQAQQMALGLRNRQKQSLMRVRNALRAVRDGTYGMCRRCRQPIPLERLRVQPDAVSCVACAR